MVGVAGARRGAVGHVVRQREVAGPVVVGVDGSPESYRALDWALAYAQDTGRDVRLVHVYGSGGGASLNLELAAQSAATGQVTAARELLETAVGYARSVAAAQAGAPGGTDDEEPRGGEPGGGEPDGEDEAGQGTQRRRATEVVGELHLGSAAGALREESRTASLVVVGSRGHGGLTGLLLGSVGVPVSAHASCPVVVVRGTQERTVEDGAPVVVGIDGSGEATEAVGFAMAEAQRHGCPLTAVLAWDELWIGAPQLAAPVPTTAELQEHAVRMVSETLAGWAQEYPDVRVTRVVERGRPGPVLLREAVGARMVVVGSRGRGGFGGLLLGSTSQTLLHRSPVDVAVVRRS